MLTDVAPFFDGIFTGWHVPLLASEPDIGSPVFDVRSIPCHFVDPQSLPWAWNQL
jgi:hypothetical protein